jgi:hypothetical protein
MSTDQLPTADAEWVGMFQLLETKIGMMTR